MTYPYTPGFKGQMDTGKEGAALAEPTAATRRAEAKAVIGQLGEASCEMIAERTGHHWYLTRPRVAELKKLGEIIDTGKRVPTGMGGRTALYRLATTAELALHHARKAADAEHGEGA